MAAKTRQLALRTLMDTHELNSQQVHEITGYHPVVIRQWLNGDKTMSPRAIRVCQALINEHAQKSARA